MTSSSNSHSPSTSLDHKTGNLSHKVYIEMDEPDTGQEPEVSPSTELSPQKHVGPFLVKYGVFMLILLLKVLYTYRHGLIVVTCAVGSWFYLNSILTSQIALRNHARYKQATWMVLWTICCAGLNIFSVIYWLNGDQLLSARFRFSTHGYSSGELSGLLPLLWVVVVNDLLVKFCIIIIKCLLTLVPSKMICLTNDRRAMYALIERMGLLYRSVVPVVPWFYFLLGSMDGLLFSTLLFVAYFIFKILKLYGLLSELKTALKAVMVSESYKSEVSPSRASNAGNLCYLCFQEFSHPVSLHCEHIFCENCVSVWLDRSKSCPLCKTKILTADSSYRDGSGSPMIQFF